MELWIRSQNKDNLVKVEKIELLYDYLCCDDIQLVHVDSNKARLGSYATKERALEVLDEIQEAKLGNFHYRCPSNVKVSNKEDTIVYMMPEE